MAEMPKKSARAEVAVIRQRAQRRRGPSSTLALELGTSLYFSTKANNDLTLNSTNAGMLVGSMIRARFMGAITEDEQQDVRIQRNITRHCAAAQELGAAAFEGMRKLELGGGEADTLDTSAEGAVVRQGVMPVFSEAPSSSVGL